MSNLQRTKMLLFLLTVFFIITIIVSCGGGGGGDGDGGGSDSTPSPAPTVVAQRTLVPYQGGRVAWHHGLNLIAFDHPNASNPAQNEVSIINPDGSGRRCLTCNMPALPVGLRGQPAWHPSGEYLVIQSPNLANIGQSGVMATSVYHGPGRGINNDLLKRKPAYFQLRPTRFHLQPIPVLPAACTGPVRNIWPFSRRLNRARF